MPNFLRLPWLLGGLSLSSRNALTAFFGLEASAQRRIINAVKELDMPYSRKKLTAKARLLHEELAILDVETLYNTLDAFTDLTGVPLTDLPEVLAEVLKDSAN